MNTWIKFTRDEVLSRVRYSEDSCSGLVWAEDHGGIRNKMYKKDSPAGTMAKSGYSVGLFGKNVMCNRLVYWLFNPEEDLDGFIIHNKDWNKNNNRISNLEKLTVQDFRRLVINKNRESENLPPSQFLDKYERARVYRDQNKEKIKEHLKIWHENNKVQLIQDGMKRNKERRMWQSAKERANKYNLPFTIEVGDIIIPTHCPILGIPLYSGPGRVHANSPSIDRITPSLGYTKDNIWVISHKANLMKTNATKEELIVFAAWILGNLADV